MEKLDRFELDAAFVTGQLTSVNFDIDYLETDEVVLLSSKELDVSSIFEQKWAVFPTGCPFRKRLENWLEEEGGFLEAFIEIGSLETLLNCVKAGLASTILPKSVLTGSYED